MEGIGSILWIIILVALFYFMMRMGGCCGGRRHDKGIGAGGDPEKKHGNDSTHKHGDGR